MRRFQRDARGGNGQQQEDRPGQEMSRREQGQGQKGQNGQDGQDGEGSGQQQSGGEPGEGSATAEGEGSGGAGDEALMLSEQQAGQQTAAGAEAGGDGAGNEAGGKPLGQRQETRARGHETEAHVASGAGPNRAEVIGGAASRGFAQHGYAGTFREYEAAVEDALTATAVPEGRRYVVRRYFDLIRPRTGGARSKQ